MARQSKNLSNAFERFSNTKPEHVTALKQQLHETEVVNVTSNSNTEDVSENVIPISNTSNITKDVTVNSNTVTVTNDVTLNGNTDTSPNSKQVDKSNTTVGDIKQDLLSMYEEKSKKEKVEDTHIRTTFLFRKDLAKRLDKLSKNKRGFKTMFINKAIEALLDEMEEK